MAKKIMNYTSQVPAERTVGMIEVELVSIGADRIEKTYSKDGVLSGLIFGISLPNGAKLSYKIPANVDAARSALKEIPTYRKKPKAWIEAQATRTAWRIIYDWVKVQVAMIMLAQTDAIQVFLPYTYDPRSGETFYDKIKGQNFQLLIGE